jgi:hypothetical protein
MLSTFFKLINFSQKETLKKLREVEEQLLRLQDEVSSFTDHETSEGNKYYFNKKSNESTWDKPKVFSDL